MTDFSKCPGHGCPINRYCRRYTIPAGERQVWTEFRYDPETGCGHFVEVDDNVVSNGVRYF